MNARQYIPTQIVVTFLNVLENMTRAFIWDLGEEKFKMDRGLGNN
jgi:hypothetical protein